MATYIATFLTVDTDGRILGTGVIDVEGPGIASAADAHVAYQAAAEIAADTPPRQPGRVVVTSLVEAR